MRVRVGTTAVGVLVAALAGCGARPAPATRPAGTRAALAEDTAARDPSATPGHEARPREAEVREADEERLAAEADARAAREKEERERRVASLLARAGEEIRAFRFGEARRLLEADLAVPADETGGARDEIERARLDCSTREAEFEGLCGLLKRPEIDRALAGKEVAFGVALVEDFGFDDLARKHFRDLRLDMSASAQQAGILGLLHVGMLDAFAAAGRGRFREALAVHEELAELERELPRKPGPVRDLARLEFREAARERGICRRIAALADPAVPPEAWPSASATQIMRRDLAATAEEVRRLAGLAVKERDHVRGRLALLARAWCLFIDSARALPPGDPARREAADEVLRQVSKLIDFFDENGAFYPTLWATLLAGRTQAVGGHWEEAHGSFDEVVNIQPGGWNAGSEEALVELRQRAFLWKTEAAFEAGDLVLAARTADLMLSPFEGYPPAIAHDAGSRAALLRAEALVRLPEPDRDGALRECARVARHGPGSWPEAAREVAAWVEAGARGASPAALRGDPLEPPALAHLLVEPSLIGRPYGVGTRRAALRLGSTRQAEEAVDRALEWLAREQRSDGTWSGADAKLAGQDADVLTTGLALLAFLGAGHTEKTGKYGRQEVVARAVAALAARQDESGRLGRGGIDHVVAGLALAECFAMARVERTGEAARRATDHSVASLIPVAGSGSGWPVAPGEAPDVVSTAWLVMQLRSAHLGGLALDCAKLRPVVDFLDGCTRHDTGQASRRPGGEPDGVATAAALATRMWLGWREGAVVSGAAERLAADPPRWGPAPPDLDYLHFGGLAMFQAGGDGWRTWNAAVRDDLVRRQRADPWILAGSWDPFGEGAPGHERVGTTAVCALALEVYYRYLPVLRY